MLSSSVFTSERVFIVIAFILSFIVLLPLIFNMYKNKKYTYISRLAIVFAETLVWLLIPIYTNHIFKIGMVLMPVLGIANLVGLFVLKFNRYKPQLNLE